MGKIIIRSLICLSAFVGFAFWGARITFAQNASREEMLANFESGTYQGWTLHGNCFGQEPASDGLFPGQIEGYSGSRFLCTLDPRRGTAATGTAVSSDFTIDRPALRFLIGGGYYPNGACLNLVVDGKIVRTETGNGCAALYPASWDVSDLQGKTGHLEVLDATTAVNRGYIMVDDIVLGYPARRAAPGPSQTDGNADGQVGAAQDELPGTPLLIKTFAQLNAARLHAHLPLLALDPTLMAAAQEVAAAQRAHTVAPVLPADCQIGSFDTAEESDSGNRRMLLEADCKTVGLALSDESASGNAPHEWTVVYSQQTSGQGDVVAVATPSEEAAPVSQGAVTIAPMPISGYSLRPIPADDSHYSNVPVLPGFGGYNAPAETTPSVPSAAPTASASGLSVFPVLDGASWSDTFGAPRVGHKHQGEDLMAPKMRPLVACFDGIVTLKLAASPTSTTAGNMIHLTAANGWTAIYMHVNCDTPGTMDGNGGAQYAFAAGLKTGDHVHVGQLLGYTGDSGNARGGATHCHFELHPPRSAAIDPAAILRAARILRSPEAAAANLPELPNESPSCALMESDALPSAGEIQIDGVLSAISPDNLVLDADSVSTDSGSRTLLSPPRMKAVNWTTSLALPSGITLGKRVIVVGADSGPGTVLSASLLVFRL